MTFLEFIKNLKKTLEVIDLKDEKIKNTIISFQYLLPPKYVILLNLLVNLEETILKTLIELIIESEELGGNGYEKLQRVVKNTAIGILEIEKFIKAINNIVKEK